MDRVRNFAASDLSQDEKVKIGLLVSKKVLDPTVWTTENFPNEDLLEVCKLALREQQLNDQKATETRSASIHYKKMKEVVRFSTFTELTEKIEKIEKWMKVLKYSHYDLRYEFEGTMHPLPLDLHGVPTEGLKIVISVRLKGFSVAASANHDVALASMNSLFKTVGQIPRDDDAFPECDENLISKQLIDGAAERVVGELKSKAKAINLDIASEYTMREFISPILIAVVNLIIDYRSNLTDSDNSKLSLVCERLVVGMTAHGPVDYVILFDFVDLVLSEAKKLALDNGIIQCLLQQRASQQFLANTLIDFNEWGDNRKRKFEEAFDIVSAIPSYGVTSTGNEWVLSSTSIGSDHRTAVVLSNTIKLDLQNPSKETVSKLLSRLTAVVLKQILSVKSSTALMNAGESLCKNMTNRMKVFVDLQSVAAQEVEDLVGDDVLAEDE